MTFSRSREFALKTIDLQGQKTIRLLSSRHTCWTCQYVWHDPKTILGLLHISVAFKAGPSHGTCKGIWTKATPCHRPLRLKSLSLLPKWVETCEQVLHMSRPRAEAVCTTTGHVGPQGLKGSCSRKGWAQKSSRPCYARKCTLLWMQRHVSLKSFASRSTFWPSNLVLRRMLTLGCGLFNERARLTLELLLFTLHDP